MPLTKPITKKCKNVVENNFLKYWNIFLKLYKCLQCLGTAYYQHALGYDKKSITMTCISTKDIGVKLGEEYDDNH